MYIFCDEKSVDKLNYFFKKYFCFIVNKFRYRKFLIKYEELIFT